MNGEFVFTDKVTALTRTVGKAEIVEGSKIASGVYLPMLYYERYVFGVELIVISVEIGVVVHGQHEPKISPRARSIPKRDSTFSILLPSSTSRGKA